MKRMIFGLLGLVLLGGHAVQSVGASLRGVYEVRLQVGDKEFRDLMTIDKVVFHSTTQDVVGTMTVPGVFTSKFTGQIPLTFSVSEKLSFDILADENGKQYRVHYDAFILEGNTDHFSGRATLEDGSLLGEFKVSRLVKAKR